MSDKNKNFKQFRKKINEDGVPVNAVGGGNIAGAGIGPQGEPGKKKKVLVLKRFKDQPSVGTKKDG